MDSYTFFGTKISPKNIEDLLGSISDVIKTNGKRLYFSLNLHGLYLQFVNKKLNQAQLAADIRIDGMPLILLSRIVGIGDFKKTQRVTWMDLKDPFFKCCNENRYRLFYLGSSSAIASKINGFVALEYPNIDFKNHHGYFKFSSQDEKDIVSEINDFSPNILLLGMGMPRQEIWGMENKSNINANAILSCGAAMEYIVGEVRIPPRWMGQMGLEWLYRLLESPKRFGFRYLIEPFFLLFHILRHITINGKL